MAEKNKDYRTARILHALRLLREVQQTLNVEKCKCPHCNTAKYDDFTEYQLSQHMDAAVSRVEKVLRHLGG